MGVCGLWGTVSLGSPEGWSSEEELVESVDGSLIGGRWAFLPGVPLYGMRSEDEELSDEEESSEWVTGCLILAALLAALGRERRLIPDLLPVWAGGVGAGGISVQRSIS